jgi:hypothetical protein
MFDISAPVLRLNSKRVQTSSLFLLLFCGCVQHGWMLVSHALAYVTASKNGVSEPEIEDFISLDDKVGF